MTNTVLYSMVGDRFIESYDPQCILCHRIFGYKETPYLLKNMEFPDNFEKLKESLIGFPIISHENQIYHSAEELLKLIHSESPQKVLIPDPPVSEPQNVIMFQWAASSFHMLGKAILVKNKNNWERFKDSFRSANPGKDMNPHLQAMEEELSFTREQLKRTFLNRYDYEGIKFLLEEQLLLLDQQVSDKHFITGDSLRLSDLMIFAILHLLFHPNIEETRDKKKNYPSLMEWAKRVDQASSSKYTKKINI